MEESTLKTPKQWRSYLRSLGKGRPDDLENLMLKDYEIFYKGFREAFEILRKNGKEKVKNGNQNTATKT